MSRIVIVGGGPAGLMAAEVCSSSGHEVVLCDAMPTVGRKFLLAGRGGLNLTHAEAHEAFAGRFGDRSPDLAPMLDAWGPQALREWTHGLGIQTFVGSSNRVFPTDMKAAPLLRAWMHRLRSAGVRFHMRHRWTGEVQRGATPGLVFDAPSGQVEVQANAVVLALGGASWSRLGSDGAWVPWLRAQGVDVAGLRPANCGFDVAGWTPHFVERFAGQPFKSVALRFQDGRGRSFARKGEFVATATGVEGSLIYAAAALLRDEIERSGQATFELDLLPDRSLAQVQEAVRHPRGARSLASHLKSRLHLDGIKASLLHELLTREQMQDADRLAHAIKAAPITLVATRPIDEAISTAGGVRFEALGPGLGCSAWPGVFCAGEMLDWEAPTGGYLLTASMATGRRAGLEAVAYAAGNAQRDCSAVS